MRFNRFIVSALSSLSISLIALQVVAAESSELVNLKQKAQSDQAEAYQYAQQIRANWESDIEFDYVYGVLALSQKKYAEAQFSLERVVTAQPANLEARLALSKAYYYLGDHSSAQRQFIAIEKTNPPPLVVRDINAYINKMSADQNGGHNASFSGFVEMMGGLDINVNSATTDETVLGTTPLDDNSRRQISFFSEAALGLEYQQPLTESNSLNMKIRLSDRNNASAHKVDNNAYKASTSFSHVQGDHRYRGTLTVQNNRISDSDFQEYYSLAGDWLMHGNNGLNYFAGGFINRLQYPDDNLLDVNQYIVYGGLQKQQDRLNHSVGLMAGTEESLHASGDHNAKVFEGIYYDARYDLDYKNQVYGRAYMQASQFQGREPVLGGTRDDVSETLSIGLTHQVSKPLRTITEMGYTHNNSDVDYYSFNRIYLKAGVRYSF